MAMDTGGPYLTTAVFCDEAVIGQDQAVSLIRIIDTVDHSAEGPDPPEELPPFVFRTKLVVSLKAGKAKGRYTVLIRPQTPDGRSLPAQEQVVHLDGGGHSGVNLITQVQIGIELEGLYWFDILFASARDEETLLTRVPLLVRYLPRRTPTS